MRLTVGRSIRRILWPCRLVWGRLRADPVLTASLLLAWIAFVALLAAVPMYVDAANQHILTKELTGDKGRQPAYAYYFHYVGGGGDPIEASAYAALRDYLSGPVATDLAIPRLLAMHYASSDLYQVYLKAGEETTGAPTHVKLGFIASLEQHGTIIEGHMPRVPAADATSIDVLVSQALAEETGLNVGDELLLFRSGTEPRAMGEKAISVPGEDDSRSQVGVRIAGIWAAHDPESEFWYVPPQSFDTTLLLPEESYIALAEANAVPRLLFNLGFYQVYDGSRIHGEDVAGFLGRMRTVQTRLHLLLPGIGLDLTPGPALLRYQRAVSSQALQIFGFLVPFAGLIAYFVVTVAGNMIDRQQLEIALLKSRGASSAQVMALYIFQAGLMGLIALPVGLVLGQLVAQGIGITYSFLRFSGQSLPVAITRTSILYALLGVLVAGLASVLPALSAAQMTLISAKQEVARSARRPFWQRRGLDFFLLAVALYGYYVLRQQGRLAFLRPGAGQSPLSNPLLFLAPALFILACALLLVRIFPLVPAALSRLAAWSRGVAMLMAFRNLSRVGHSYGGLLLLLTLGMGLATYAASTAETIDRNTTARIRYQVGADVALKEGAGIVLSEEEMAQPYSEEAELEANKGHSWMILPLEYHLMAPGVEAAARIARLNAQVASPGALVHGTLFGIDRGDFPQVAYFRSDFAPRSLGSLMNLLAREPSGILVSRSVLAGTGLNIGDIVPLSGLIPSTNRSVPFQILAVLDYFPTVYPEKEAFFVANLDYITQQIGGDVPYDVWLSVDDHVGTDELIQGLKRVGLRPTSYQDSRALAHEAQIEPARTGLFGFFSVGFIVTVGLCMLAQVIYALVSFGRRFVQFGMLRAVGLSRGELARSLSGEMGLITALGIAAGLGVGLLANHMFIPFLQIGYRPADLVPPFEIAVAWRSIARAAVAMAAASAVTNAMVVALLARVHVPDALKLGESLS